MIKIDELAVSDVIGLGGSAYKVSRLDMCGAVGLVDLNHGIPVDVTTDYLESSLEPILVTEDVIRANESEGMIHVDEDDGDLFLYSKDFRIGVSDDGDVFFIYTGGPDRAEKFDSVMVCKRGMAFHEVQHMLRMCNLSDVAERLKICVRE